MVIRFRATIGLPDPIPRSLFGTQPMPDSSTNPPAEVVSLWMLRQEFCNEPIIETFPVVNPSSRDRKHPSWKKPYADLF